MHDVIVRKTEGRQDNLHHHLERRHIFVCGIDEVDRVAVSHKLVSPNLMLPQFVKADAARFDTPSIPRYASKLADYICNTNYFGADTLI